jgi:hypothetical protein
MSTTSGVGRQRVAYSLDFVLQHMYVSCIECTLFLSAWLLQLPGESNARSPGLAALVRVPTARGLFLIPYMPSLL